MSKRSASTSCVPAIALLIVPLFLYHRSPILLLCALWPIGIIGLVAVSDLWLGHGALEYVRYTLAAAPMVFVGFVAISEMGGQWLRHVLPALALAGGILAAPQAYADQSQLKPEVRELAYDIETQVKPGDVLVVASRPEMGLASAGLEYLGIDYYAGPLPCAAAVLEAPADQIARDAIWSHKRVWLVQCFGGIAGSAQIDPSTYLGRCKLIPAGNTHLYAGRLFLAEPFK